MKKRNYMLVTGLCVCTLLNGCSNSSTQKEAKDVSTTVEATATPEEATATPEITSSNNSNTVQGTFENKVSNEAIKLFDSYINGTNTDTYEVKAEECEKLKNAQSTSKTYEKFNGTWNRTECENGYFGTLSITNANVNGFDVENGEFMFYSHSGELMATKGYFLSDTKAVVEYSNPDLGGKTLILMDLQDDKLHVIGIGGEYFGFGANVTLDGTYTLGEPEYTNQNALDDTFTKEEQKMIKDLMNKENWDYEEYFLTIVQYGVGEMTEVTAVFQDGSQKSGKWFSGFVPTMGGYEIEMFLSEDGHIYYENSTQGFITDDKKVKIMPKNSGQD
ncbi:MAG: hypothetical protein PUC65_08265 [Clostridiales bacterium]|nr:hypothetical protein [Clostridiales bacterium]